MEQRAHTTTCKLTYSRVVLWTDSAVELFQKYVRPSGPLRLLKTSAQTRPPTQNQSAGPGTDFIARILPEALAGLLPGPDQFEPTKPGSDQQDFERKPAGNKLQMGTDTHSAN